MIEVSEMATDDVYELNDEGTFDLPPVVRSERSCYEKITPNYIELNKSIFDCISEGEYKIYDKGDNNYIILVKLSHSFSSIVRVNKDLMVIETPSGRVKIPLPGQIQFDKKLVVSKAFKNNLVISIRCAQQ